VLASEQAELTSAVYIVLALVLASEQAELTSAVYCIGISLYL